MAPRILFFTCFAMVFASLAPAVQAQEKYTIVYFVSPPHILFDEESFVLSGALYDFLNEDIAPAMGIEFEWDRHPTNIPRQTQMLKDGNKDIAAVMAYTPERAELFAISKDYWFASQPALALLHESPLQTIAGIEDFLDLTVGYADKNYITPLMRDPRIKFRLVTSSNAVRTNLMKLVHHRVQSVYTPNEAGLLMEIIAGDFGERVKVLKLPEPASRNHLVFAKHLTELAQRYDEAFIAVGGHQRYLQKLNKYIDTAKLHLD